MPVFPSGTGGQYPPCCFEASRGLKLYSLHSHASPSAGDHCCLPLLQPTPRTHHAPCIKSQGTARAGLGGLHPTQGRACEEARPQASCLNPHPASRSSFLPWKPPGSHGKASPGLSGPACGWGSSKHCLCFVSSRLLLQPGLMWAEGLRSLIPPCPMEMAMTRSRQFGGQQLLGTRQDSSSHKLAMPGHDPPAPKDSFSPRTNFIPCLIEKSTSAGAQPASEFRRVILQGGFVGFVVWGFF